MAGSRQPAWPHRSSWRWALLLLPAAVSLAAVLVFGLGALTSSGTPSGGDLGAHIYPFHQLVTGFLPHGWVRGWSDGWFGGFPLFYFYFPFPAFLVAALRPLVGFAPALKLTLAAGVVGLPWVAYLLVRNMGATRLVAAVAGAVGGSFVFLSSYSALGGNLLSTVVGEFSYSLGFTLSLLYMALMLRTGSRLRDGLFPGCVLAAALLSHIFPAAAAVASVALLGLFKDRRRPVLASWVVAGLLAAFWVVPFLLRHGFISNEWVTPRSWTELLPPDLWLLLPFALASIPVLRSMGRQAIPFTVLWLGTLLIYLFAGPAFRPSRFLPFWYFALHLAAGLTVGTAVLGLFRRPSLIRAITTAAAILVVVGIKAAAGMGRLHTAAAGNLAGYEARSAWPEYHALMTTLDSLPAGRVYWEQGPFLDRFGGEGSLMAIPYWTRQAALLGLWSESSLTAPYELRLRYEVSPTLPLPRFRAAESLPRFDLNAAVRHLRLFGVQYFVAFTPPVRTAARQTPGLHELVRQPTYSVFGIGNAPLVQVSARMPVVYPGADFDAVARIWFDAPPGHQPWVAAAGPADWPRVAAADLPGLPTDPRLPSLTTSVDDVRLDNGVISFHTTAIGLPHLIKVPYFPNWVAEGAAGPFRVMPDLMLVVPRSPDVTLRFRPTIVEHSGDILSLVALAALILFALTSPIRNRVKRPHTHT